MMENYLRLYRALRNSQSMSLSGCRNSSTYTLVDYKSLVEDASPQSVIVGLLDSGGRLGNTPTFASTKLAQIYTFQA